MRFRSVLAAAALSACGMFPAYAASIPYIQGPTEPPTLAGPLNTLINQINAILSPLTGGPAVNGGQPGSGTPAVNNIQLISAATGSLAQIGLQPGADPNAGIQINPNGSGNIVLFALGDTGVLQFANTGSFVSAPGLSPYPGRVPGALALMGVQSTVQGAFVFKDWLGITRGVPAY